MTETIDHHQQRAHQAVRVERIVQQRFRYAPHEHGENVATVERELDHTHDGIARQWIDVGRQPYGIVWRNVIVTFHAKRHIDPRWRETIDPGMHVGRTKQRRQRFRALKRVDGREGFVRAIEHAQRHAGHVGTGRAHHPAHTFAVKSSMFSIR